MTSRLLEKEELLSSTWLKLEKHITERIGMLRASNDADLDPVSTALVRGRIRELKVLLDLSKDDQAIVESDD